VRTARQEAIRREASAQLQYRQAGKGVIAVVRSIKRMCLCALVAMAVTLAGGASAALARSPWWHLSSGSRPASVQPGTAKSEVEEVTVSATSGVFFLVREEPPSGRIFNWEATHEEVQKGLEEMYGAGNVEVSGGPGDEKGSNPYKITFTGALADHQISLDSKFSEELSSSGLSCEGAAGPECMKEARITEKVQGRADGVIVVTAADLGDASVDAGGAPVRIADTLPAGLKAVSIEGIAGGTGAQNAGPVECSLEALVCTFEGSLLPYRQIEVKIGVLSQGARSGALNTVNVSGGGAPSASIARPVRIGEPEKFGVEDYELAPEEEGGAPDTQAGSHPFQLTTTLTLNQTSGVEPVEMTRDLHFKLPAGLIGNPTPFAQCTLAHFLQALTTGSLCSPQTIVGVARVTVNENFFGKDPQILTFTTPIYNLEPSPGEPARFGFTVPGTPVYLDTEVRTGGDYGVTVNVTNIAETAAFISNQVTFWGVPGDARHDAQRGEQCLGGVPCSPLEQRNPPPLLSLPTSCTGPLQTSVESDSWAHPGDLLTFPGDPMPALDGCNRLPLEASIDVAPDGQSASTPTGLTVGVHVPQKEALNANGLAPADVKDTTVTLPAGVVLNPAAADGLQACSEEQITLSVNAIPSCPEASKVATLEIKSPLLPNPLTGEAYLAAQTQNPFGSLLALYLVAQDPVSGVLVKLAGEVKADPVTGQLVSAFKDTPQLPFEDLKLHFFGGNRAPLGTPAQCGSYTTTASIAPWSGGEAVTASSTFNLLSGPNGTPCQSVLPFGPSLTAGTTNIQAGGFSPFTMTMSREDGNQNLQAISLHMPPGLSGLLSSVKLCAQAQANAGTCGPESEIGETIVSVGLGGDPFSVKGGKVFVTEGYGGAPYGLSIVNPAKAGPFDLGVVVVRAKIEVDPITSALTITSDSSGPYKIPTILDGIPLQIRHVNVTVNRPGFTFNPTNCNPMQITGSLSSSEGATSALSVPLQVTNCAVLGFKPQFTVSTTGKTSRANGASLHVKLVYPKAPFGSQANIRSVKVDLPKQLPSRLSTLQKACPDSTFDANPAACPSASRIGEAKTTTPLLPVPLAGPVYFVSHGGAKFPELVIVLSGYGTTVQLHAETFISKAGITSSTFRTVPDVPVGTFELTLPQGRFSALAANGNLCSHGLLMPTQFAAQNGLVLRQATHIEVEGCTNTLSISSHSIKGNSLTLSVVVPSAGKLTANGKGLVSAAKSSSGRESLTLTLKARRLGRLRTRVLLRFTPTRGKQRNGLRKSLVVTMR
jgi:hypothetical protein